MSAIILHGYFRSGTSHRLRAVLALKGLSYTTRSWDLAQDQQKAAEYRALNPQALVPALEIDGRVLTQTMAIVDYLDQTRPQPRRLIPEDPAGAHRVRALSQIIGCDIHPINNRRVLMYLRGPLGLDEAAVTAWAWHWISEGFAALEAMLTPAAGTGTFAHGAEVTFADVSLVAQAFSAERFGVDLAPYPTIQRIVRTCLDLQAFIEADPRNQPDAV